MVGGSFAINPWFYLPRFPVTYSGEWNWVEIGGQPGGRTVNQIAAFHELAYVPFRGVNTRLRHDFFDPDLEVTEDHLHRLSLQVDFFPFRYTELQGVTRIQIPSFVGVSLDYLLVLRGWL